VGLKVKVGFNTESTEDTEKNREGKEREGNETKRNETKRRDTEDAERNEEKADSSLRSE
jgi:hypothetical protein